MKRLKVLFVLLLTFSLTGCIKEYTITEEQNNNVAEYMAGMLLKYDKNYDKALSPEDELMGNTNEEGTSVDTAEDNETAGETNTEDSNVAGGTSSEDNEVTEGTISGDSVTVSVTPTTVPTPTTTYSMTDVIGLKDFGFAYSGYKLAETYPENAAETGFSVIAGEGTQLLVATVTIENTSGGDKELNLINEGITYRLDIDSSASYEPLLTLLENDLQYIDVKIGSGKKEKALLVFEVSKTVDLSNANLIVMKGDKSSAIKINK